MSVFNLLPVFSRLSVNNVSGFRNISLYTDPLYFRISSALLGEPLKRKKKVDPAIIKAREDRKVRKITKEIRRLQKNVKQLKPIIEIDVPLKLKDEREQRLRKLPPLSEEEIESRIILQKEWNRYKNQQWLDNFQIIDTICYSQQRALDELRGESEELYQEAIKIDFGLLPYTAKGPFKTPPIQDYDSPDGEYINTTKKFDGEE